jgi:5-methylcytosine-specific restriction endonuclease McrA
LQVAGIIPGQDDTTGHENPVVFSFSGGTTITKVRKMKTQNTPDPAPGTSAAEITDNTNKIGECAYCGDVGIITRDHVPPKGIFPKPRPANLITVPACSKCHSQQTSRDDEYFRNTLNVREDLS